jgi:ELWxxDGT repeat protein
MKLPVRPLALVAGCVWAAGAGLAEGPAYRVKDLETEPWEGSGINQVGEVLPLGPFALIEFAQPGLSLELGRTDGTAPGTRLVRDLWPGTGWGHRGFLGPVAGGALFAAKAPGFGAELWWSDGTPAGTRLVKDIRPRWRGSLPRPLGSLPGFVLFWADDGEHGNELWRSDGTAAGTTLLADLVPGPGGTTPSWRWPPAFEGPGALLLFFLLRDEHYEEVLWRTDGTAAGTFPLMTLAPLTYGFRAAGDRLYFPGRDAEHGRELWSTDGTVAGTGLVVDLVPGPGDSQATPIGGVGGRLAFVACDTAHGCELWSTDGSAAGTQLVADILPGPGSSSPGGTGASAGGRLLLAADDGAHGRELWATDGTAAGTLLLDDLRPGAEGANPSDLAEIHGGAAVSTQGASWELRLWSTTGQPGSARLLAEFDRGEDHWVSDFRPVGDIDLFHFSWATSHFGGGSELWRTDGSPGGTYRILEPLPDRSPSYPRHLTPRSGGIVLAARGCDPICASDGTEAGTTALEAPEGLGVSDDCRIVPAGDGEAVLSAESPQLGFELYRTDGDVVSLLRDISPDLYGSMPYHLTRAGDLVFFQADDGVHGVELWRTDGSTAGTTLVEDLAPGEADAPPHALTPLFDRLWFGADAAPGLLFESRGTAATTFAHSVFDAGEGGGFSSLTASDDALERIVFVAGGDVWSFDARSDQRHFVRDLDASWAEDERGGPPLARMGDRVYFFDLDPDGGCALWGTDGTSAGTARVRTTGSGEASACPRELVAFGPALYFGACTPARGCELWRSDGTADGTLRLTDVAPGPFSFLPGSFVPVGNRIYFKGCDLAAGCEPWVTNGTAPGTHRVADVFPGPGPGLRDADLDWMEVPRVEFARHGRLVFFAGDDGTGTELWAMRMELFYDGFETGNTGRWSAP